MGAWGIGILENDSACDFLGDVENSETPIPSIISTLEEAPYEEYLESDDGSSVLVAALLVLGFQSRANVADKPEAEINSYFRDKILEFLIKNQAVWDSDYATKKYGKDYSLSLKELAVNALAAVNSTSDKSELYELWRETEDFEEWQGTVQSLVDGFK